MRKHFFVGLAVAGLLLVPARWIRVPAGSIAAKPAAELPIERLRQVPNKVRHRSPTPRKSRLRNRPTRLPRSPTQLWPPRAKLAKKRKIKPSPQKFSPMTIYRPPVASPPSAKHRLRLARDAKAVAQDKSHIARRSGENVARKIFQTCAISSNRISRNST